MDTYQVAQRAVADLKAAVLAHLRESGRPLTNSELGRALGIYANSAGHEGHLSWSALHMLKDEGLVRQDGERGPWVAV